MRTALQAGAYTVANVEKLINDNPELLPVKNRIMGEIKKFAQPDGVRLFIGSLAMVLGETWMRKLIHLMTHDPEHIRIAQEAIAGGPGDMRPQRAI